MSIANLIDFPSFEIFSLCGYTGAVQQLDTCQVSLRKEGNWVNFQVTEISSSAPIVVHNNTPIIIWDSITNSNFVVPIDCRPAIYDVKITCLVYNNNSSLRTQTILGVCTISASTGNISFGQAATGGTMPNNGIAGT